MQGKEHSEAAADAETLPEANTGSEARDENGTDRDRPGEPGTEANAKVNAEPVAEADAGPVVEADAMQDAGSDTELPPEIPRHGMALESAADLAHGPSLPYPLVAFGASAGGIQAFGAVLDGLPPDTGMTYVLITHLAADQKSYLAEIMERHTAMPVLPVEQGARPLPNHVYILLPNTVAELRDGAFQVEERGQGARRGTTIDIFFRSVAADQKTQAIGVVLSGADSDGAQGLKTIKGEGGVAIVQTPESAIQPGMPRSSIAADHVDMVLPPEEIAAELARLAGQFGRGELRTLDEGEVPEGEEQAYQRILQLLRNNTGLELRNYKPQTIRRRLARRMLLLRKERLTDYYRLLQTNAAEMRALQEDVLIGVTRFFRDPELWESLRTLVLPTLFADRSPAAPIRVWCAGCSTGEEAYSLAITVLEYMGDAGLEVPLQIFGTDASDRSIETARAGMYPLSIAAEIPAERLRRYFVATERGYQISKRVRDVCIFARQNLTNDPPFSHIDVLSCRNVLIYFNQALQRKVISTFHYALEPGGYMMLGLSEGLREFRDLFTAVDRKTKIYSKLGTSAVSVLSSSSFRVPEMPAYAPAAAATHPGGVAWPELELQRAADRLSLSRYGPAGLVIDDQMNVLQTRGQIAPYLQPLPGATSWSLARVLRASILQEVKPLVERAVREALPVSSSFPVRDETGSNQQVHVDVLPITTAGTWKRCFLLLFQMLEKSAPKLEETPAEGETTPEGDEQRLVSQLRQDLSATRFHLQSLLEERDARNQELVSANEEIQSANEELQSTNEELETTKEELQSANEELQTVNEELQQRNLMLAQTGNDLSNLLNSLNIPMLMLTSDLKIRQFTPPMQRLLNVRTSDIGRSINEIRLQLSVEDIEPLLLEVLETLGTRDVEVQDRQGKWFLMRMRPYRTAEDKIEGIVLVLLDIDQLRSSQQRLLEARDFASSVLEGAPIPVVVLNRDFTIRTVNTAFRALTQMPTRELTGHSLPDLMQQIWGFSDLTRFLEQVEAGPGDERAEFEHTSTGSDQRSLLGKAQAVQTDGTRVLLLTLEDITVRRGAEQRLARQRLALESEMEQATRRLDRSQEELRLLTAHLFSVQEEERRRVARTLDDHIADRLSVLERLLTGRGNEGDAQAQAPIEEARRQVQDITADVRGISQQLHPAVLEELGLVAALKTLVEEFGRREQMPATFVSRELPEIDPQPAATAVYRITQEALRNVAEHAGRTHVKVILEAAGDTLHLEVRDLGAGFDPEASPDGTHKGLGLISMEERARLANGTLSVRSTPAEGTTVTADLPFQRRA